MSIAQFPEILSFLIDPNHPDYKKRNKVAYGGRGGLKSWAVVDAALIRGVNQFERILFARETLDSIRESSHQLLSQRVYELGLAGAYEVQERTIYGPEWFICSKCLKAFNKPVKCTCGSELRGQGRTEIIFAGLRHNVRNIKSVEGVTICVVEEAAEVSQDSWDTLLPTIRWEDKSLGRASEVWIIFNPKLKKDATYQTWLVNTPPDTVLLKTSWRDAEALDLRDGLGSWFPTVLRKQMEHMKATDFQRYLHVWEGECVQALEGAIYRLEYAEAESSGRICQVPYTPGLPVDTYWDLGFGDTNAIWLIQHVAGWHHVIGYLESRGRTLDWYIVELQKRPYAWGTDYLPHDGVDAMLHGKLTGDRSKSPDQVLRALGRRVQMAPKLEITTGINAGRSIFPLCRFDEKNCREGLDGLQQYQWGPDAASGQERTKPLHNWASHPADGFRTFAVSAKQAAAPKTPPPPRRPSVGGSAWA